MYLGIRLAVCAIHLLLAPVVDFEVGLSGQGTANSSRPADLRKYLFYQPGNYHCEKPYLSALLTHKFDS